MKFGGCLFRRSSRRIIMKNSKYMFFWSLIPFFILSIWNFQHLSPKHFCASTKCQETHGDCVVYICLHNANRNTTESSRVLAFKYFHAISIIWSHTINYNIDTIATDFPTISSKICSHAQILLLSDHLVAIASNCCKIVQFYR